MSDLIRRDEALAGILNHYEVNNKIQNKEMDYCFDMLNSLRAVDAVEIPCKIGDVVWTWLYDWRHEAGISPYQITNLIITQNKKGIWTKKYRAMQLIDGKIIDRATHFGFDEIGKEVFFSKEEAEKMLLRGDEKAVD